MTGCARPISAKPDLQDQRDSLITRPLVGWIGRALFLWSVAKLASCSFETWIGVFLTGSVVNNNTLFAPLQVATAGKLSVDPSPFVAANTAGGNTAKVIVSDIIPGAFTPQRYDYNQQPPLTDYDTKQLQLTMTLAPDTKGLVATTSKRVISSRFVLRNR